MNSPNIKIEQHGFLNRQENIFNFHPPKKSEPIPSDVRQGSPNFVGRKQELDDLDNLLQQEGIVALCAVRGMGGVGKTELAIQYALSEAFKQRYAACYWFSLNEGDLTTQVLLKAKPYLAMPEEIQKSSDMYEQVKWCWQNWHPTGGDVLVILDDVQSLEDIPKQAMPIDSRFKVMLTTRQKNLSPSFRELLLGVLPEGKAIELLEKIVGEDRIREDLETAKEICRRLEYLPLALELAATYRVEDELLSLRKYLERLNLMDESLSDEMVEKIQAERGVVAAFDLSWQQLQGLSSQLAMVLGRLAPDEIPWEGLVEPIVESLNWESEAVRKGRMQLSNLHLISITERKTIKLHSLLREYFRYQGEQVGEAFLGEVRGAIASRTVAIAKTIPPTPVKAEIEKLRIFIPHLEETSAAMLDDIPDPEANLIWAFLGTAWFYEGQGLYRVAEPPYQICLAVMEDRLGADHPAVATSLNNLALLYKTQGRYAAAEPLYERSLQIRESQLGADHPDVALSLNNLAALYNAQGCYAEAEPLYERSLQIRETQLGADHPAVATSLNNLAELYRTQGRYAEAETLRLRCLEIERQSLGEEHPQFAASINNLAGLYEAQGRYAEAEPLYERSLQIQETQLGADHSDVALSLNNLAELYYAQGRYAEVEPLYERSLQIYETYLGVNHPLVATSLNNLAALYEAQGRCAEAEPLYERSLQIRERQLGADHPDVASSLNNLAKLYHSQGHYAEAKPLYERSLQIFEMQLGADHPDVATSLNNLAGLYYSQGRYAEVEPLYERSLQIYETYLGVNHPLVATSLNNLAALYEAQGRCAEAEPLYERSLQIRETQLGANHPDVALSLNNLAALYDSQGRYGEAEPLYARSLAIFEAVLGANHPNTQTVRRNLQFLKLS